MKTNLLTKIFAAPILAGALILTGCTGNSPLQKRVEIENITGHSASMQSSRETISQVEIKHRMAVDYFSDISKDCLKGVKIGIVTGDKVGGRYADESNTIFYNHPNQPDVLFLDLAVHEIMHRLDIRCNLIDRARFNDAYNSLSSKDVLSLKKYIEFILSKPPYGSKPHNAEAERIAYTGEFLFSNLLYVPEKLAQLYSPIFNKNKYREIISKNKEREYSKVEGMTGDSIDLTVVEAINKNLHGEK